MVETVEPGTFDKVKSHYNVIVLKIMAKTGVTTPLPFHIVVILFSLLVLYRLKVLLKTMLCGCN